MSPLLDGRCIAVVGAGTQPSRDPDAPVGNGRAIAEMKACGYSNLDDEWDILGYLEQYRPSWMPPPEPEPHAE